MIFKLIFAIWQKLPLKRKIITILSFLLTSYLTIIIFGFLFNLILAILAFYLIFRILQKLFNNKKSNEKFKFYNLKNNSFEIHKSSSKNKDDDMIELNPK